MLLLPCPPVEDYFQAIVSKWVIFKIGMDVKTFSSLFSRQNLISKSSIALTLYLWSWLNLLLFNTSEHPSSMAGVENELWIERVLFVGPIWAVGSFFLWKREGFDFWNPLSPFRLHALLLRFASHGMKIVTKCEMKTVLHNGVKFFLEK